MTLDMIMGAMGSTYDHPLDATGKFKLKRQLRED